MTTTGTPSFSALYASQTVAGYYTAHGSTYRNPHEPGIRKCLAKTLDRLLEKEGGVEGLLSEKATVDVGEEGEELGPVFRILDLAAGGGEAGLVAVDWAEKTLPKNVSIAVTGADPFTSDLFRRRTGWQCSTIGFRQVLEGSLLDGLEASLVRRQKVSIPSLATITKPLGDTITLPQYEGQLLTPPETPTPPATVEVEKFDLTIISFALHLVTPSEMVQTLNMLALSSRFLVVLVPNRGHLGRITADMGWEVVDLGEKEGEPWCWVREKRDERVGAGVWRSCMLE